MTTDELIQKHKLLQNVYCGVSIADGWAPLVDKLTTQIEEYVSKNNIEIAVDQVKEKFGTLRYYISGGDKTVYEMIRLAENTSSKICERCGNPGYIRDGGWLLTLCDPCAINIGKE